MSIPAVAWFAADPVTATLLGFLLITCAVLTACWFPTQPACVLLRLQHPAPVGARHQPQDTDDRCCACPCCCVVLAIFSQRCLQTPDPPVVLQA